MRPSTVKGETVTSITETAAKELLDGSAEEKRLLVPNVVKKRRIFNPREEDAPSEACRPFQQESLVPSGLPAALQGSRAEQGQDTETLPP